MAKVTVACRVVNGLELRLFRQGYDDGTGARPMVRDGVGVRIDGPSAVAAGVGQPSRGYEVYTHVDSAFWDRWAEQNKLNPYLVEKLIYEVARVEEKD